VRLPGPRRAVDRDGGCGHRRRRGRTPVAPVAQPVPGMRRDAQLARPAVAEESGVAAGQAVVVQRQHHGHPGPMESPEDRRRQREPGVVHVGHIGPYLQGEGSYPPGGRRVPGSQGQRPEGRRAACRVLDLVLHDLMAGPAKHLGLGRHHRVLPAAFPVAIVDLQDPHRVAQDPAVGRRRCISRRRAPKGPPAPCGPAASRPATGSNCGCTRCPCRPRCGS
jgi:hypothetical protein